MPVLPAWPTVPLRCEENQPPWVDSQGILGRDENAKGKGLRKEHLTNPFLLNQQVSVISSFNCTSHKNIEKLAELKRVQEICACLLFFYGICHCNVSPHFPIPLDTRYVPVLIPKNVLWKYNKYLTWLHKHTKVFLPHTGQKTRIPMQKTMEEMCIKTSTQNGLQ